MSKPIHECTVGDLMSSTVQCIRESDSLNLAIQKMSAGKVPALVVQKTHDRDAYGIITRKAVVVEAAESWDSLATLKVQDLATKPAVDIQANVGIKHAVRLMRLVGVRRLLVMQGDKLVGVISNGDIFRRIALEPPTSPAPPK